MILVDRGGHPLLSILWDDTKIPQNLNKLIVVTSIYVCYNVTWTLLPVNLQTTRILTYSSTKNLNYPSKMSNYCKKGQLPVVSKEPLQVSKTTLREWTFIKQDWKRLKLNRRYSWLKNLIDPFGTDFVRRTVFLSQARLGITKG